MEWQPHLKKMFWTVQEGRLTSPHSILAANLLSQTRTLGGSGGRGEESVAGRERRTARLQYFCAWEPGGRQPRNRHDENDPLLLAPQKERTSNFLWVLVFLLLTLENRRRLSGRSSLTTRRGPATRRYPPHGFWASRNSGV